MGKAINKTTKNHIDEKTCDRNERLIFFKRETLIFFKRVFKAEGTAKAKACVLRAARSWHVWSGMNKEK